MTSAPLPIRVAALYRFTRFADPVAVKAGLDPLCERHGVFGTLLIAGEGINGTIAGPDEGVDEVIDHIRTLPGCADIGVKWSRAAVMPFHRMKVRLKREIVTMGQPDIDPLADVGQYVAPTEWNALIGDPDTIVIDTRNDYEVAVGSFAGAIDPQTRSFAEFPVWFRSERDRLIGEGRNPRIAMFCTGGIRCEKATAFVRREGLDEVYHLDGGILNYLETVPEVDSLWRGECFVFDHRVTVRHGLAPGSYGLCHGCRRPVGDTDRASPLFEEGVSCPACHGERDDRARAGYAERHRQERLAGTRGERHVGARHPAKDDPVNRRA